MTILIMFGLISWLAFVLYFAVYIHANHNPDYNDDVLNRYKEEYEKGR